MMEWSGIMLILTARVPKRRLIAGAVTAGCCCVALAVALIFTLGGRAVTASAEVKNVKDNDDRVAYLNTLGWEVGKQPIATEELLIPETFDDSYKQYLALQVEQGFDLTQYCGKRVKRYIYEISNHPNGETGAQAALLIYKNRVVGGQVQGEDGSFLHSLIRPAQMEGAEPSATPGTSAAI